MQLIWVSGPAAKVVTVSITTRTVLTAVAAVSGFLVLLGFVFNLIGLRVAVEYVPELAHRMGGVTSHSEQQKIEADYRGKLEELNQQLSRVTDRMTQLEQIKNKALGRLGLEKLLSFSSSVQTDGLLGRGGPMNLLPQWRANDGALATQIDQSLQVHMMPMFGYLIFSEPRGPPTTPGNSSVSPHISESARFGLPLPR
jgi:hypothetical protein